MDLTPRTHTDVRALLAERGWDDAFLPADEFATFLAEVFPNLRAGA